MKKSILFDLDGTLLPLNEKVFVDGYFAILIKKLSKYNLDSKKLISDIWAGTKRMYMNDGKQTNEKVFWDYFMSNGYSLEICQSIQEFYDTDFSKAKQFCRENPFAKEVVEFAKENFDHVILATNPIFPKRATLERMSWIGLKESDFEYISFYENSSFSKPNPIYYTNILKMFNINPQDAIMVGNNDKEDYFAATAAGIETIIIDDNRIKYDDITIKKHCEFKDLKALLQNNYCNY